VDYWANELPGFVSNGVKAGPSCRWTGRQGGDAIVADENIKTIEDLKGKKIRWSSIHRRIGCWNTSSKIPASTTRTKSGSWITWSAKDATLDARQAFKTNRSTPQ